MTEPPARLAAALADRYTIERPLGTGGMATVYLALDRRHDRQVALKVLKPELAAVLGAERFVVEIKTTAALQHPHILPLFDSGEAAGFLWYAMPYVEGETLRSKLDRENQLGVDEAVRITAAVADALDYAHRQGVIHRDIKPENILLHDGRPVVADFGIALAVSAAAGGRMTETGLSLGTPHYMSPEQATADREITGRSDIYSLGSVCYEMLTGDPPHTGSSAQQIIMKIVTEDAAPVTRVRKNVPPNVAAAVGKAIEKLPADRFATAADFARALENPAYAATAAASAHRSVVPSSRRSVLLLAALALLASALAAWGWLRRPAAGGAEARRLDLIAFPDSLSPVAGFVTPTMSLAPDGRTLVYMTDEAAGRLAVREPDRLRPRLLAGTENAKWPQVSPDGRSVLFTRGPYLVGSLEVVPIAGGTPRVLVPDSVFVGASWGPDGSVYYQRSGRLLRRGPDGGTPEAMAEPNGAGGWFRPLAVAGGLLASSVSSPSDVRPVIHALPRDGGETRLLTEGIALAYLEPGMLVVLSNAGADRVFVAPFDPRTLTFTGELAPLAPAFPSADVGWADIAVSHTALYYRQRTGAASTLVWVDRSGRARPVDPGWEVAGIATPALSPDGRRVAVAVDDRIVIKQLDDGPAISVVPSGSAARALRPAWRPDGRAVAYFAYSTSDSVRVVRDDGVGAPAPLVDDPRGASDAAWSPDGRWIVYRTPVEAGTGADIMVAPADGSAPPRPLVATPAQETTPTPSPDGRWLAYSSDESGRPEVYVRPFPNVGDGRWQVSARGGGQPRWAAGSGELFYVSADGMLIAARFAGGPGFEVRSRTELFPIAPYQSSGAFHHDFDVTRDGQRFIMVQLGAPETFVREEHWLAAHPELPR